MLSCYEVVQLYLHQLKIQLHVVAMLVYEREGALLSKVSKETRKTFWAIQRAAYFICFDITITKTTEFVLGKKFQSSFTSYISFFLT